MTLEDTQIANAFKKINMNEISLTENQLKNGLTLSLINKLIISGHAKRRGKERFNFKNDVETDMEVRGALKVAKYVGLVPASDGNESHLYVHNNLGIHISNDYTNVNTLVPYSERYLSDVLKNYEEIRNAIIELQLKEMKKLNKTRIKLKKKVVEDKLDFNIEIAELQKKIYKSKSEKAKEEYNQRIEYLLGAMLEQEESLKGISTKIRTVGGSLAYLNK